MEPGFTPLLKSNIMKYFFNVTPETVSAPTPLFAGLFVDQGGPESNELVIGTGSYARAPISFIESDGVVKNVEAVTFPKSTASWTPNTYRITHLGIFTSHKAEDSEEYISDEKDSLIAFLPLAEAEIVEEGQTFQLNPQTVKLQLV